MTALSALDAPDDLTEADIASICEEEDRERETAPQEPLAREYRSGREGRYAPGEHQEALITLLESCAPGSRYHKLFLQWAIAWRDRSAAGSRKKYEQKGEYDVRRFLIREAKKEATLDKKRALKRELYHTEQAAKGKTTRRNRGRGILSAMTDAERLADKKAGNARRKRDERRRAAERKHTKAESERPMVLW